MADGPLLPFTFRALAEAEPGPGWAGLFAEHWPAYRRWFLQEGDAARPSYAVASGMLAEHMPELVPTYERLCALAGGGDLAARMLAMVEPPPFLSACSQGVIAGRDGPVLVRNYDYLAERLEGVLWWTAWTRGRVIGMSDLLWGLLDGMNDDGLAVSLTFGGRRASGRGFGIPLVVRYVLETCRSVREAIDVLDRLPYQLAHNLTLVDASGDVVTAYLAPDRRPVFARVPVATNHQDVADWPEYTAVTRSHEREGIVRSLLDDPAMTPERFAAAFLVPPLRDSAGNGHFGTLYTAVFHPREGRVEYRWPGFTWHQSFDDFAPGTHEELLPATLTRR